MITCSLSVCVTVKAMTHQPTQLLSRVELEPVGVCVIGPGGGGGG